MAEKAAQVACVPYDIVSKAELRNFVEDNPLSFLRVTRPRYEFQQGEKPSWDQIFEKAKSNLEWFVSERILKQDDDEAIFIYRLKNDNHSQTGVVACLSLDEYEAGIIKKHENVKPDKVEERTGHILTLRAQTGLIFLTFRGTDDVAQLIAASVEEGPAYDFEGSDGIRHTVWRVAEAASFISAFESVPAIYIADGHHRIEAALQARNLLKEANTKHRGDEDYNFVMAAVFPAEELKILPYNRVIRDLNGLSNEEFLKRLGQDFSVDAADEKAPMDHGIISMYTGGHWYRLTSTVERSEADPIERLDVSTLQNEILGPVLGITDPRTDERLSFVGSKRSVAEIERLVDAGEAAVGFSLYPPTVDEMLTVSDMGETMPPKSTWFEPKLKDGLLIHLI